ncbi:MAG: formylglycine-generating enzyme family protein [Planctomycetota bacterium]
MNPSITLFALTVCFFCTHGLAQDAASPAVDENALPAGIVNEKPDEGFSVEITDGPYAGKFMVAYDMAIPGTDVIYKMTPIPGGSTVIGSPDDEEDRNEDEGPQFTVTTEPFWAGVYEVTWREFEEYMKLERQFKKLALEGIRQVTEDNAADAVTAPSQLYDPEKIFACGDGLDEPVGSVSQYGAKQYTKWLSLLTERFYRLPTEAEWEHMARCGTTTPWYFGDDPDDLIDHGWYFENGDEVRMDVGQLEASPWGLYDIYGNVAEWTLDGWVEEGYARLEGGNHSVEDALLVPTRVTHRVLRGGCFENEDACELRSSSRVFSEEWWRDDDPNSPRSPWWLTTQAPGAGFRIIRPLNIPEDDAEKLFAWDHDVDEVFNNAMDRMNTHGKGSYGIVDPELPADIEKID